MVTMLASGHMGHNQGPLWPIKNAQTKQKEERGRGNQKPVQEKPKDRPAEMHTTTHQFCNLNEQEKRK